MTLGTSNAKPAGRMILTAAALCAAAIATGHPLREIAIANIGDREPLAVLLVPTGADCNGPLDATPLPQEFRRGPVPVSLAGPCAEKAGLAVFSADRAAVRLDAQQLHAAGRRLTVNLKPALRLPVQVWYDPPTRKANATDDIANANWIFRRNLAGFVLQAGYEPFPAVERPTDGSDFDCTNPPPAPAFKPGTINLYYGISGESVTCEEHDRIFVKASDGLGTLAHELGHALGLDSPDGDPEPRYDKQGHTGGFTNAPRDPSPFDGANGMWRRSLIFRDSLTLGQIFWMNFNSASAFPSYRESTGFSPGLPCRDKTGECPFFRVDPAATARNAPRPGNLLPNLPCPQARIAVESTPETIRTAIEARLIERPRYCTQPEVRRILEQRYSDACSGGACGSTSPDDFVERWGNRSGGIAAWVSEEGARIFAMRRGASCDSDADCRERAATTERTVIGYITNELITRIKDKRILWLDDPEKIQPEAEVFRKLLVAVDFERDKSATYALVIASRSNAAPLLKSGAVHPALVIYQPGRPYSGEFSTEVRAEAKEKGAAGLTDCPLELYNIAVGQLLAAK